MFRSHRRSNANRRARRARRRQSLRDTRRTALVLPFLVSMMIVPVAGAQIADSDGDGLADPWDNCAELGNPDQRDSDRDGFGDLCDGDFDNDGAVSTVDFGSYFLPAFQAGVDGGNGGDMDGDGAVTVLDFGSYFLPQFEQGEPGPGAIAPPEEGGDLGGNLRQGWIDGRTFTDRPVVFEDVGGVAMFEGDIILGQTEDLIFDPGPGTEEGVGVPQGIILTGDQYRWQDDLIPYVISPEFPSGMRTRILDAIDHWEANTIIDLVERTPANASEHPDWVEFTPADGICSSAVGRRGNGRQMINLDTGCGLGAVIHEIGHTVGLWHEQSREDRDDYVEIRWENIQAGDDGVCNSGDEGDRCHNFNQHIIDGDDVGAYDYASIMHYPRWAFSRNGEDTVVPLDPSAEIGQRDGLSAGDIAAVQHIYGTLYPAWLVSYAGTGRWTTLEYSGVGVADLGFGDFDGDGRTDVFRANPSKGYWYVSYGGQSKWQVLNSSGVAVSGLSFGDFDGDGRTDVFRAANGEWRVSYGGSGRWTRINASNVARDSLRFGDFDGDGRTDVFRASSGTWWVSYGGTSGWTALNASIVTVDRLRFEDFDGDGRTDVFKSTNGTWSVSYGGVTRWTVINSALVPLDNLAFGDFDGDGRADVFKSNGGMWSVSYGGTTRWTPINTSGVPVSSLRFEDFDGDGRTDVFRHGSSY